MKNEADRIEVFRNTMYEAIPADIVEYHMVNPLKQMGFFTAPASTKYHGNYPGGLFDHSFMVTKCLLSLTRRMELTWNNPKSPYVVGMFHDLCKCDQYRYNEQTKAYEYRQNLTLCGHGEKSVILAQQIDTLSEEEILCIRWHMGAYETDTKLWNNYGAAIEKYPNVLWTHTADMMASRIFKI